MGSSNLKPFSLDRKLLVEFPRSSSLITNFTAILFHFCRSPEDQVLQILDSSIENKYG